MKFLSLSSLILLASCASHHHDPAPGAAPVVVAPTLEMKSGVTYEQTAEFKKDAGKCVAMASSKYCEWDKDLFVFKNNGYEKTLSKSTSALEYDINVNLLIDGNISPTKAYIEPLKKKVNAKSIEWRRALPVFKAILVSNGYVLVEKKSDADEVVKFAQGITPAGDEAKRTLNVVSHKNDIEAWKIEIMSVGKNRDMKQVLPVLGSAARDSIARGKEENTKVKVAENSLSVMAFKDAVASQK